MSSDAIAENRERLRGLLARVPPRVNGGSVQVVQQYKDAVAFGNKQLASSRATLLSLQQAVQRLQSYQ